MKKVVRLTEKDLSKLIKKIIVSEQSGAIGFAETTNMSGTYNKKGTWSSDGSKITLFDENNKPVFEVREKSSTPSTSEI